MTQKNPKKCKLKPTSSLTLPLCGPIWGFMVEVNSFYLDGGPVYMYVGLAITVNSGTKRTYRLHFGRIHSVVTIKLQKAYRASEHFFCEKLNTGFKDILLSLA